MTVAQIFNSVEAPNYRKQHIATFQNTKQIVEALRTAELDSRPTSKRLAVVFNESNKKAVAAKVWYFLRNEIFYFAEPPEDQNAKSLRRFLADKTGDCKHFATFAVGVLNACGIPAWFTFVGQDPDKKKPNHAYCTALIDGKKYTIDPCRKYFNSQCDYFYRWDINRK